MHNYTDDVITEGPNSPENKGCFALQKQTLTNHLKLSGPLLSTSAAQRGCFFHLTGEKMRWCSFDTAWKTKSTRTCGPLQLNLPGMLIQSRDWSFQEVRKVGQEKLLFDLQWPGRRERRKMRRRRVMGPGSSPKTVSTAHLSENQGYYTTNSHNRTLEKLQFLLHTLSWAWILLFD